MSEIIPLRKPQEVPEYISLTPQAREAFAALKGRVGALERCFAGSFVTSGQAETIARLTQEIQSAAQLVYRRTR